MDLLHHFYNKPLEKALKTLQEPPFSVIEDDFINESFNQIEKIAFLHLKLSIIFNLEIEIVGTTIKAKADAAAEQLDNIELKFADGIFRILNYKRIHQVHLHHESLSHFMFYISCAAFLTATAVATGILLAAPLTTLTIVLLSTVIASTLVLLQINWILSKDESPLLSFIKTTIDVSINEVKNLVSKLNTLIETIRLIENEIDSREKQNSSLSTPSKSDPFLPSYSSSSSQNSLDMPLSKSRPILFSSQPTVKHNTVIESQAPQSSTP